MKVIISEEGQNVISFARLLKKKGVKIILASPIAKDRMRKLFRSKAIDISVEICENSDPIQRVRQIKEVYEKYNCDSYIPFGYRSVTDYMESVNRDDSLCMNSPYGRYESYWDLSDKDRLYSLLKNTDIPLPERFGVATEKKIPLIEKDKFPIIVKATRGKGIKGNIRFAQNRKEIIEFLKTQGKGRDFLLQRYIPGDIFDVGGFAIEGTIFHHVPQKRSVTLPFRGGVAAVNDIYHNDRILKMASKIIKKAKWSGPFQVEFRYDPSSEEFYLLEVNAKMWGSLQLTLRSNPDIVDVVLKYVMNEKAKINLSFKRNLRQRWIAQEMMAMRHGNFMDISNFFLRFFKKSGYDFDMRDPLPDMYRYYDTLRKIIFHPEDIPKPLIDKKTHKNINQNL